MDTTLPALCGSGAYRTARRSLRLPRPAAALPVLRGLQMRRRLQQPRPPPSGSGTPAMVASARPDPHTRTRRRWRSLPTGGPSSAEAPIRPNMARPANSCFGILPISFCPLSALFRMVRDRLRSRPMGICSPLPACQLGGKASCTFSVFLTGISSERWTRTLASPRRSPFHRTAAFWPPGPTVVVANTGVGQTMARF